MKKTILIYSSSYKNARLFARANRLDPMRTRYIDTNDQQQVDRIRGLLDVTIVFLNRPFGELEKYTELMIKSGRFKLINE